MVGAESGAPETVLQKRSRAIEVAHQVRALTNKPDDLSSDLELPQVIL